jgi:FAD-dependent urate hydroxylase
MPDREVAIIGAGPYGLAAAARLRARGVDTQVFGDEMGYWRQMPRGMLLRSPYQASSISDPRGPIGLPAYEAERGASVRRPIPLEEFIRYGEWVQRLVAPDIDRRRVQRVEQNGAGFRLAIAGGDELHAGRVVIAIGLESFPRPLAELAALPSSLVSHTADLSDPSEFAGRRVLVIGGGQSAIESAALLHEGGAQVEVVLRAGGVRWLTRTAYLHRRSGILRPLFYPDTDVGPPGLNQIAARPALFRRLPIRLRDPLAARCIRPAASAWLVDRTAAITISTGRRVARAAPAAGALRIELDDGTTRMVDHAILGTGFKLDVRRQPLLAPHLVERISERDGYPRLGAGYESSVPGLHFIGAMSARSFGPIMRFVCGTWYTGAALERSLTPHPWGRRRTPTPRQTEGVAVDAGQPVS